MGQLREYVPEFRSFSVPSGAVWRIVHRPGGWSIEPYRSFSSGDWLLMAGFTALLLGGLVAITWGIAPRMKTSPGVVLAIGAIPVFIGLIAIWGAKLHTTYAQRSTQDLVRCRYQSSSIELPRLGREVEIRRLLAVELASVWLKDGGETITSEHLVLHILSNENEPSFWLLAQDEAKLARVGKFIARELEIPVIRTRRVVQRP